MNKANKVPISGRIDPDLMRSLDRFCELHKKSRSEVMTAALRFFVTPEYQEEREKVITETLDRLYWTTHRLDRRLKRETHILKEMLGLFVRAFYNHTPRIADPLQEEFKALGKQRFEAFMEVLAAHVQPGQSMLEQLPVWSQVREDDFAHPDADPSTPAHDSEESTHD